MTTKEIELLIRDVKDFPKEGIIFRDISPILASPKAMKTIIDFFVEQAKEADVIVAPDARGFLFGPQVAMELNIPFVMVRKPDKLPGEIISTKYELEYNSSELQMQVNSIKPGDKVVIIDDLLATGGTTQAIIDLVEKQDGKFNKALFLIELLGLMPKSNNKYISMIKLKEA